MNPGNDSSYSSPVYIVSEIPGSLSRALPSPSLLRYVHTLVFIARRGRHFLRSSTCYIELRQLMSHLKNSMRLRPPEGHFIIVASRNGDTDANRSATGRNITGVVPSRWQSFRGAVLGGARREELLAAVADERREPHFQLRASHIEVDFPTRGTGGAGRKVGEGAVARGRSPWGNERGETKEKGNASGLHGKGRPPASDPQPPTMQGQGTTIVSAGRAGGQRAWFSRCIPTSIGLHQLHQSVPPMRGEAVSLRGQVSRTPLATEGGKRQFCCRWAAGSTRLRQSGWGRKMKNQPAFQGGFQQQGLLGTHTATDRSPAADVAGQVGIRPPVGRGRQTTIPSWTRVRAGGSTLAIRGLQRRLPGGAPQGGGKGVTISHHAPSTEGDAAGERSCTSNSRDAPSNSSAA